jgi:hypothetical protein
MSTKIKLENTAMREAYYELSDKIIKMRETSKDLDNPHLNHEVKKLEECLAQIHFILEQKYIWD